MMPKGNKKTGLPLFAASNRALLGFVAAFVTLSPFIFACGQLRIATSNQETKTVDKVKPRITLQQLEAMFAHMRSNPVLHTVGDLLWGYFYTDPDPRKLEGVVEPLTRAGFTFGSIYPTDAGTTYFLHVERIEKHTPD